MHQPEETIVFHCKAPPPTGLHTRSAGVLARGFAEILAGTQVSVRIQTNIDEQQRQADGRSILEVIFLGLGPDVEFDVELRGVAQEIARVRDSVQRHVSPYVVLGRDGAEMSEKCL